MRVFTVAYTTIAAAVIAGTCIPTLNAQAQGSSSTPWMDAITAEKIFSLTFILVTVGVGRFIDGKAWPWLTKYFETKQRFEHEFRNEQQALTRDILQTMSNVSFSLGKVISLMEQIRKEFWECKSDDDNEE